MFDSDSEVDKSPGPRFRIFIFRPIHNNHTILIFEDKGIAITFV